MQEKSLRKHFFLIITFYSIYNIKIIDFQIYQSGLRRHNFMFKVQFFQRTSHYRTCAWSSRDK